MEMTSLQQTRYQGLKIQIRNGLDDQFKIGEALREIRDNKWYEVDGHDSFEGFCKTEYNLARQRAYQLMDNAKTRNELPVASQKLLTSPSQADALKSVPPKDRPAVIEAAASHGKITAASLKTEAEKLAPKPADKPKEPEAVKDCDGVIIPKDVLQDWNRAETTGKHLRKLAQEVTLTIKHGRDDNDPVFTDGQIAEAEARTLFNTLSHMLPHGLCPKCKGIKRKTCNLCKGRGFIDKALFETPGIVSKKK